MKTACLFLCLAIVHCAFAKDSSDGDDSGNGRSAGVAVEQSATTSSSKSKTQKMSSKAKVVKPAVAVAQKVKSPRPAVAAAVPQTTYVSHQVLPQVNYIRGGHHLDVFHLSNGLQAVALDDPYGHVSDYVYLGNEINLISDGGSYNLPATDLLDGHTTYVNLDTNSGHLSLSEAVIDNSVYQGFQGYDEIGPVFVPVSYNKSHRLTVQPIVYRTDRLPLYTTKTKYSYLPAASSYASVSSSLRTAPHHIIY